jgi:hypothetical protein
MRPAMLNSDTNPMASNLQFADVLFVEWRTKIKTLKTGFFAHMRNEWRVHLRLPKLVGRPPFSD